MAVEEVVQDGVSIGVGLKPPASFPWVKLLPVGLVAASAGSMWVASAAPDGRGMLVAMLVLGAAAAVASVAGFAFSVVAGSVLYHLVDDPKRAVTLMLWSSIAIQAYSVARLYRSISWRRLGPFLLGGLVVVGPASWFVLRLSGRSYVGVIGWLLVAYSLYMMLWRPATIRLNPEAERIADAVAGAFGGVTGPLAAFPGGPVTIWIGLQGLDKTAQRAIFQPYILIMQVVTLVVLAQLQGGSLPAVGDALVVFPALLGCHLGLAVFDRLSTKAFNVILYALLLLSGASMVLR